MMLMVVVRMDWYHGTSMAFQLHKTPQRFANFSLGILALVNLFNYMDRYVVSALFESLKHSKLALSDLQLGLLMPSFLLVYMFSAPIFGALGDSRSRPRLIAFGVVVWSLATSLSAFAGSYLSLMLARGVVGVGEAAYGTIAPALLADYFPLRQRGRVMAIFFCAIPVGAAFGYIVGGLMDAHYGWRSAFFVAGVPGIVLAALCWKLRDPPRGGQEAEELRSAPQGAAYRSLLGNKPYVLNVLGYTAYTFAVGGLASWMPAFLERVRGLSHAEAAVNFGSIVVATGFVGTFAGGWLGDYLARHSRSAYLWLSALATLAAVPFVWGALTTHSHTLYTVWMVIAELLLFLSTGPVNAATINLVSPSVRATALALQVFFIHLLGDVISPPLIGAISDATSLSDGVKIVPLAVMIAGIIWAFAAYASRVRSTPHVPG